MNKKAKIGMVGILLLVTMILVVTIPAAMSLGGQVQTDAGVSATQTNSQGIPGLVCFKYNDFADTWILSFVQTGPKEFQASGYDSVFPASMAGGGAIVSGNLLLTLDERGYNIFSTGGYAQHNIMINISKSPYTGKDHLAWFNINGTKMVNYPKGLNLTEIACPAGTQPMVASQKSSADI
jgi:hypothetical protein